MTPNNIKKVIDVFNKHKLKYILFKCEHIFNGENKNLDILFETTQDYNKASIILEELNFKLYMDENIEKYKRMYVNLTNEVTAIHLHREIAWHGVIAIDKKDVFENMKNHIPSKENSLIIHVAHALFENYKIKPFHKDLINKINTNDLNWNFINQKLTKYKWKKPFYEVLKNLDKISKLSIIRALFSRLNVFNFIYLILKIIKSILRKLNPSRKGFLITLNGVNGSGKSSLSKNLIKSLEDLAKFKGVNINAYYFGWKPYLSVTKIISKNLKKKGTKLFKEKEQKQQSNIIKNLIYVYTFFEYLARYVFEIYPKLRKGEIIITDRYYYDNYGQYSNADKSFILKILIYLFPSPDKVFVLDADIEALMTRDKGQRIYEKETKEREVAPKVYLLEQKQRYIKLSKLLNCEVINTNNTLENTTKNVLNKIWKKLL